MHNIFFAVSQEMETVCLEISSGHEMSPIFSLSFVFVVWILAGPDGKWFLVKSTKHLITRNGTNHNKAGGLQKLISSFNKKKRKKKKKGNFN